MRTITEGQAIELLHTHFLLSAPVAFEDVKKKYRQESKRLHPDAGGSEDAFKALSGAFDGLKQLYQIGSRLFDAEPLEEVAEGEPKPPSMPRTTIDGTPLSELGLGLGPTTNGRDCPHCEHRGYTITKEHSHGRCTKCGGKGMQPREYPCNACSGTGKFTQARSGRVVDCLRCNGSGKFQHPHFKEWCTACHGSGRTNTARVIKIYVMKCWNCKGTGEIEIWNPVIPKGRLTFTGQESPTVQESRPTPAPKTKPQVSEEKVAEGKSHLMNGLLAKLKAKGIGGEL